LRSAVQRQISLVNCARLVAVTFCKNRRTIPLPGLLSWPYPCALSTAEISLYFASVSSAFHASFRLLDSSSLISLKLS
jgi:hypothetical protein